MTPVEDMKAGDLVQLAPSAENPMFAHCFMTVVEPKPWGAVGYVQGLGEGGNPGGAAYYRAKWEEMERCGFAVWMVE